MRSVLAKLREVFAAQTGLCDHADVSPRIRGSLIAMDARRDPYYGRALALVHHRGFGFHAAACAPGIIALLEPVRARNGLVLKLAAEPGYLPES